MSRINIFKFPYHEMLANHQLLVERFNVYTNQYPQIDLKFLMDKSNFIPVKQRAKQFDQMVKTILDFEIMVLSQSNVYTHEFTCKDHYAIRMYHPAIGSGLVLNNYSYNANLIRVIYELMGTLHKDLFDKKDIIVDKVKHHYINLETGHLNIIYGEREYSGIKYPNYVREVVMETVYFRYHDAGHSFTQLLFVVDTSLKEDDIRSMGNIDQLSLDDIFINEKAVDDDILTLHRFSYFENIENYEEEIKDNLSSKTTDIEVPERHDENENDYFNHLDDFVKKLSVFEKEHQEKLIECVRGLVNRNETIADVAIHGFDLAILRAVVKQNRLYCAYWCKHDANSSEEYANEIKKQMSELIN